MRFPHNQSMNPCGRLCSSSSKPKAHPRSLPSCAADALAGAQPVATSRQVRHDSKTSHGDDQRTACQWKTGRSRPLWEGDSIIGRTIRGRHARGTLTHTLLSVRPNGHTATEVQDAIIDKLATPRSCVPVTTWDQAELTPTPQDHAGP